MNVFMRDDSLYASNVDLTRLIRAVKKNLNLDNNDKASELVAKLLGFESAHLLRQAAKDTDIVGLSDDECQKLLGHRFASDGERFPIKGLPPQFGNKWQQDAMQLLDRALSSIPDGAFEFVAVVGGSGVGKTLLLNNAVAATKGVRLNIQNWDLYRFVDAVQKMPPSGLLALDQDSDPIVPLMMSRAAMFRKVNPDSVRTLNQYAKASRVRHNTIPNEAGLGHRGQIHAMLKYKPKVRICMSFASNDEAVQALNATGWQFFIGRQDDPIDNWVRVHIVNLDTMTLTMHENDGLKRHTQSA